MIGSIFTVLNNMTGLNPPDRNHSAAPRLNVFHIGGRYVGLPEWFHNVICNYLSQYTCGTKTQQLSAPGENKLTVKQKQKNVICSVLQKSLHQA